MTLFSYDGTATFNRTYSTSDEAFQWLFEKMLKDEIVEFSTKMLICVERHYLPIWAGSAVAALWVCGLVNFCTNRTLLRTSEARSFDMELLCFNLLSDAAYIFQPNETNESVQLNTKQTIQAKCEQIRQRKEPKACTGPSDCIWDGCRHCKTTV